MARLDARGMLCDQAVLAAMRAMRGLEPGETLEILTAAESVRRDLRAWADRLGHPREGELAGETPGELVLTIRKRPGDRQGRSRRG